MLLGIGFGQLIGRLIVVVQSTAPAHQIGVATTGIRFFLSLGTAVGAAALGSVLSRVYEARSGTAMSAATIAGHPGGRSDFTFGIEVVFLAVGAVVLLAMLFSARLREESRPRAIGEPEPAVV
ncbi:hypothetical protein [Dactylosporangium sp. CA-139066]|uniref:hypothetical protein n=1 Tax=Dactylosporangium sp. CA-139066 TaxID=3239930 RepID=UPI003D921964